MKTVLKVLAVSMALAACGDDVDSMGRKPRPRPRPNPTEPSKPEPQPQPNPQPEPQPNPQPQPSPGGCYKGDATTCEIDKKILDKTNAYRSKASVAALAHSDQLQFAARDWSVQQAAAGKISHDGFPDARNAAIKKEFPGSNVTASGENVAMFGFVPTFGDQGLLVAEVYADGLLESRTETPISVRDYELLIADTEAVAEKFATMWYNSQGHRENMLRKEFKTLGNGTTPKGNGYYSTQLFGR